MNNFQNQKQFFINQKVGYPNQIGQPDTPTLSKKNQIQFQNYPPYINTIKASYPDTKPNEKQVYNSPQTVNFNNNMHNYQNSGYINLNQNVQMSKSYVKKDSSTSEVQLMMRDLRQKIFKINKILHQHQQQIVQIKQNRVMMNSTNTINDPTVNSKISENIQKEDSNKFSLLIQKEIETLRSEIVQQFLKKDEFDYKINICFNQLQNKLNDRLINMEQSTDIKLKSLDIIKQFENVIINIHEANRTIFNKIQKDMMQCRQNIQNLKTQITAIKSSIEENQKINFITSNKIFYSPKIIKYKETFELLNGSASYDKSNEIVINEVIYHLDKEGYLLDQNFYYLLDSSNKPVKLDDKHLNFMKYHNILQ